VTAPVGIPLLWVRHAVSSSAGQAPVAAVHAQITPDGLELTTRHYDQQGQGPPFNKSASLYYCRARVLRVTIALCSTHAPKLVGSWRI
jgi:hypothetical protein